MLLLWIGLTYQAVSTSPALPYRDNVPKGLLFYELLEVDCDSLRVLLENAKPLDILLGGRIYRLELEVRELKSPTYRSTLTGSSGSSISTRTSIMTLRGFVDGVLGSKVRLGIGARGLSGFVLIPPDVFFIDPLALHADGATRDLHVIHRAQDIDYTATTWESGLSDVLGAPPCQECGGPENPSIRQRIVEIATDADFEYYLLYGEETNDWILNILNQIEGIYENDHQLTFSVTHQNVWTSEEDPYTSTNPAVLLGEEFRVWWNTYMGDIPRDVAHLFTGKDLDGITQGVAYQSVTCNIEYAYALSQNVPTNNARVLLTAHELGHIFAATHEDADTDPPTIMYPYPSPGIVWWFSDANIANVEGNIAHNGACLSPLPVPSQVIDLTISAVSSTTIQLDWSLEPEVIYDVFRGDEAFFEGSIPFATAIVPPWQDTPTEPWNSKYYYVRGHNIAGEGEPGNRVGGTRYQLPVNACHP